MKNLRRTIMILVLILSIKGVDAQESKREKMEALKIAYLTEKLDLTEAESKSFWPMFNDFNQEKKEIHGEQKSKNKPSFDEMSDKEIEAFIDQKMTNAQKMLDLRKRYIEKFKTILPIKKVAKLLQAQKGFKKEMLKRLREK